MSDDNIKKSLLILKANAGSLTAAEQFLRNRDWKIKSTTNLKEALIFLVQEQPQFAMISIDHPHPKVKVLPKILTQAFPVCVIAFTESTSAAAFGLLSAAATEYMLYPPVTGPAVERTVNKYYKDQQAKGQAPTHNRTPGASTEDEDGAISIKGKGGDFSGQDTRNILARMLGEDAGDIVMQEGVKSSQGTSHVAGEGESGPLSGRGGPENSDPLYGRGGPEDGDPLSSGGGGSGSRSDKNSGPQWGPVEEKRRSKKSSMTPEEVERHPKATKKDTIILKGTQEALNSNVKLTSHDTAESIQESTNVACIVIESSRFSGYLITAMGKNKSLDSHFIDKVRDRLFKFLADSGEKISDNDSMDLKIKQVPFEDWALEYAEFMRKSIHDGNEIAMAFFPRQDIKTEFEASHAEEMASIKIDEFVGDTPVEFNVYIRLPRNNKYVLYTPRGGVFYSGQKDRLKSQGVSQLHIMRADLQDVDKYRAQNFLNDKITEFEEKGRKEEEAKAKAKAEEKAKAKEKAPTPTPALEKSKDEPQEELLEEDKKEPGDESKDKKSA